MPLAPSVLAAIAKLITREAPSEAEAAALILARSQAPEQKMLQGIYRGYAGEFETPEKLFAANQKQMADYYAQRRAAETGGDPHVDMLLIDPNVGLQYRLHPPGAREMSRVRKLPKSAVRDSVNLYADGGLANLSTKYNQPELTHYAQSLLGD